MSDPLEIDVPDDGETPFFDFSVQFDGLDYHLRLRWGERAARWVLDVEALDGTGVVTGQLVAIGKDLLARGGANKPPGILAALGKSTSIEPPGIGELGRKGRVGLYYFPAFG